MNQLLEFDLADGESILVEVEPLDRRATRGRSEDLVVKAGESLQGVLGRLGPALRDIASELRSVSGPDEVEVEFAIKLSSDANVIIARAGGEANFKIVLRWSRKESGA